MSLKPPCLVYGYVLTSSNASAPTTCDHNWTCVLRTLGFSRQLQESFQPLATRRTTPFLGLHCRGNADPTRPGWFESSNPRNHATLNDLYNFSHLVEGISKDLLVFHSTNTSACTWSFDIVSWIITHIVLTISHWLLQRDIPFRAFISLPSHPMDESISKGFKATHSHWMIWQRLASMQGGLDISIGPRSSCFAWWTCWPTRPRIPQSRCSGWRSLSKSNSVGMSINPHA